MKKLIILSAMAVSGLIAQSANAQIGIHINLHLGGSPAYVEPAPVYNDDDYYYLPDVEAYYSVHENCYYYNDGYNWVSAAYLPGAYRNYDWRYARRIELRESRPYMRSEVYRSRYGGFEHRNWNYRDEHDDRMYADRYHNHYNDHDQYRDHAYGRPEEQHYDRGNYGRMPEQQYDDHSFNHGQHAQPQQYDHGNGWGNRGQQAQPQQNDRGNGWNDRGQQQAQPQQNNNRGNYNGNGQHFAQNTITDGEHGRPVRF